MKQIEDTKIEIGSFVLTDNIAVQQELLLTLQSGILNDTCDFEGTPVESSSQINTIENGKLIKEKNILLNINDCWRINLVDQFYEIEI